MKKHYIRIINYEHYIESFDFKEEPISIIKKLPNGHAYVFLFLEILARATRKNGYIFFEGFGSTSYELSILIDEEENLVQLTLHILKEYNLIEECEEE